MAEGIRCVVNLSRNVQPHLLQINYRMGKYEIIRAKFKKNVCENPNNPNLRYIYTDFPPTTMRIQRGGMGGGRGEERWVVVHIACLLALAAAGSKCGRRW